MLTKAKLKVKKFLSYYVIGAMFGVIGFEYFSCFF